MNFFLTFCKTRKKFDKYIKVNRIRNKSIIDIKSILDEEQINLKKPDSAYYFKVLIYKKISHSIAKNKDIYYLPNFWNPEFEVEPLFKIKDLIGDKNNFNLLLFHDEFLKNPQILETLFEYMPYFNASQILRDY